jgi:cysteine desulfurase
LPDADLIVLSAHKFGGPIGVGALLVRDWALLHPTGGQERGYRPGTENLPGALAMAAALEAGAAWLDEAARLRDRLEAALVASGAPSSLPMRRACRDRRLSHAGQIGDGATDPL